MKTEDHFRTSDLPLASTLLALGFKLRTIDRSDSRRYQFCFEQSDEIEEVNCDYWRGDLRIEPKLLLLHQKSLKSRIRS